MTSGTSPPVSRTTSAIFLCATLLALWLLTVRTLALPAHYSREVNEGWNALLTARLLGGQPLYPAAGEFILNNYPPLSFYAVGWVGQLTGDLIVAGRVVALIALCSVTLEVGAAVRLLGGRRQSAVAAMLGFLLFNLGLFTSYVALDDPQWLAHAVMGGGLLLLIARPGTPSPSALAGAALLLLAGGLVKHNLLALPIAVGLWLLWRDRRAFLLWLTMSAIGLLVALFVCRLSFGDAFFAGLLGHHRIFQWRAMLAAAPVIAAMLPLIIAACFARRSDPRVALILLFASIALPLGILQRGGSGVNYNAHFESLIALAIAAGVGIDRIAARLQPAALMLLPMLGYGLFAVPRSIYDTTHSATRRAAWAQMITQVRAIDGPVACEEPALCYWAGKGFEVDFFNVGQQLATGADGRALERAIAGHRYAAAVLTGAPPATPHQRSQRQVRALFDRYYRLARQGPDELAIYLPASTAS